MLTDFQNYFRAGSEWNLPQNSVIIFPTTPWACNYIPCETNTFKNSNICIGLLATHDNLVLNNTISVITKRNNDSLFFSTTITQNVKNVPLRMDTDTKSQTPFLNSVIASRQWRFAPGCSTCESTAVSVCRGSALLYGKLGTWLPW